MRLELPQDREYTGTPVYSLQPERRMGGKDEDGFEEVQSVRGRRKGKGIGKGTSATSGLRERKIER